MVAKQNQHQENRRDNPPGGVGEFSHEGNFRHEILVFGFVHQRAKQHQIPGHKYEHGQQGKHNCLDQAQGHVGADLKLHEQHGRQAADGGHAAGADLRDAFAQSGDHRLPNGQLLPFLFIAVAQNHRIVQGQCQLQNAGNGVGDKGNSAHQELGALIEDHGRQERQQQHGNLRIGLGGEQQHRHHDNGNDHHDHTDFLRDDFRLGISQGCGYIIVLPLQMGLDRIQNLQALVVGLAEIEGDLIQG